MQTSTLAAWDSYDNGTHERFRVYARSPLDAHMGQERSSGARGHDHGKTAQSDDGGGGGDLCHLGFVSGPRKARSIAHTAHMVHDSRGQQT